MTKNAEKYTRLRLYSFITGLAIGLLFIFLPRKKNRVIFNSTHNRYYNFNSKYLFEYFIKNSGFECKFVVNDDILREKLITKVGPYFVNTERLLDKIYCLNAACWITSTMETPVGGIFLSFRRFVYHLGHGVPIKSAGMCERSLGLRKIIYYQLLRTNFSRYLAPSSKTAIYYQKVYGCSLNKITIKPQPRTSHLLRSINSIDKDVNRPKKILYAPTWRQDSETILFPFSDFNKAKLNSFLEKNNIVIYLRLHPFYENNEYVSGFESEFIKKLGYKEVPEVTEVLGTFDFLITDYSSIFVDFLLTAKPIFYFPYDLESYREKVGFVDEYENLIAGPKIKSLCDFLEKLEMILRGEDEFSGIRFKLSQSYNGESADPCYENLKYVKDELSV